MSAAACRCSTNCRGTCRRRSTSASRCSRGEAEGPSRHAAAGRVRQSAEADLQFPRRSAGAAGRRRRPTCRRSGCGATRRRSARSTPDAAARSSAASARSSTCRAASRATAPPTTSSDCCAPICAKGVTRFFITDDDFARNRHWEEILDRIIELRERERIAFSFLIQVDALAYRIPNFIEKCRRAGCLRVFIGLETINAANLLHAKKRQNKIGEYRADAAGVARRRHHHLLRLHPRLSRGHGRPRSSTTSRC